jgi:hypothetical protein
MTLWPDHLPSDNQECARSFFDSESTIWIADAHRDDGKRYVVRADDKLTAFLELERAIPACGDSPWGMCKAKSHMKIRRCLTDKLARFL